ncbi:MULTISPECIES: PPOX class F420-dependent oxidoreductase [unclassified Saccharothrix]|uniref:PPOX class F420-dependent oxidoreductase n=1 Tax=unclassified Saccharothrix TaxID=2593673 RepID=UPI00307D16F9
MAISLSAATRALLDGPNYATISTINPDGSPHSSVMWITRDGDDLLLSTLRDRVKERNARRDPRVSISVWDHKDPEVYAEIRGTVTITLDEGRALANTLARKYTGEDFPEETPDKVRVVLRVTPTKVAGNAV